jgi:hypothetical protein
VGRTNLRGALSVAAALSLASPRALAFCQTTTCDASGSQVGCAVDADGCSTKGQPLYWAEGCLSFGVQEGGSPRRDITWQKADSIITTAFQQWVSADCGSGAHPSFKMWDLDQAYGPMICDEVQFNQNAPNANIWMFRDATWPYDSANATLALTTVTFEVSSGRILDADVEINSFAVDITTNDPSQGPVGADLQSIVTHESGHFLGLAHSRVADATMNASYSPGDISFRTLSADDVEGICTIYPPDRTVAACSQPEPVHGFSRYCASASDSSSDGSATQGTKGCAVASMERSGGSGALATLAATLGLVVLRRRRATR